MATNGDDSAPGTLTRPLKTVRKAVDLAKPGDTITVRGGTCAGERVVVDGEQLPASHTPVGGGIPRGERGAIHQEASSWRISGLEIVNTPYGAYGDGCDGCDGCDNNVFARLPPTTQLGGGTPVPAVAHVLRDTAAYGNAGTGFDADVSGGRATFTADLSVADGRAVALGSATVSTHRNSTCRKH